MQKKHSDRVYSLISDETKNIIQDYKNVYGEEGAARLLEYVGRKLGRIKDVDGYIQKIISSKAVYQKMEITKNALSKRRTEVQIIEKEVLDIKIKKLEARIRVLVKEKPESEEVVQDSIDRFLIEKFGYISPEDRLHIREKILPYILTKDPDYLRK
ncbi:MAG: hypothetical protein HPY53_01210 [Brevinematales bacterium]|nr:hypothetical protein [Brevinematales bacterium]